MRITTGLVIAAVMVFAGPGPAAAQDCEWSWVNPMPPRIDILRLKHESNTFIGVGLRGTVIRSTDGFEWQVVDSGVTADLHGIDWGAGAFVAVGDGVILNSAMGNEWTLEHSDPSAIFLDVEFSSSRYVAIGSGLDGRIVTSPLGRQWESVDVPWSGTPSSITGSDDGFFVAVGPEIWFSPDGFQWDYRSAVPAAATFDLSVAPPKRVGRDLFELDRVDIAWAGDRVIWAGGSELWSGVDAEKWELVAELSGCGEWQDWLAVIAGPGWAMASGISACPTPFLNPTVSLALSQNGGATFGGPWQSELGGFPALSRYGARWIALGAYGDLLSSTNGLAWECVGGSCTSLACADELADIAINGTEIVAAGGVGLCDSDLKRRSGGTVAIANDGGEWTVHSVLGDRFRGIAFFNGSYLGVGDGWSGTSSDGVEWQIDPFPNSVELNGVCAGPGLAVAVGQNGALYVSDDGVGWTKTLHFFTEDLNRVVWDGSHYMAAGRNGSVLSSTDGVNWSTGLTPVSDDLYGVAGGPDGKVAVGDSGVVLVSTDARVWMPRRSGIDAHLADVAWGDDRFVAVGWNDAADGTRPPVVLGSADGGQWTRFRAPGEGPRRVAWTGSRWVVAGADRTLLEAGCLGTLLEVDRELLQVPHGDTIELELRLSEPTDEAAEIAVVSSAPSAVQVPATVMVGSGSDVATVPVTGAVVAAEVVLTFTLPDALGGGELTSMVTVQPPEWTPRRPGGRREP